jgi:hypothetical protein
MTLRPAPELRSIVDHDGAVILDLKYETILILNPTGGYIWRELQQGASIDDIVASLARETTMDIAVIERDVAAFMDQLKAKRLFLQS